MIDRAQLENSVFPYKLTQQKDINISIYLCTFIYLHLKCYGGRKV